MCTIPAARDLFRSANTIKQTTPIRKIGATTAAIIAGMGMEGLLSRLLLMTWAVTADARARRRSGSRRRWRFRVVMVCLWMLMHLLLHFRRSREVVLWMPRV